LSVSLCNILAKNAYHTCQINKTNERAVKWTRVDRMPNIHTTDTPRVAINVGTKRGRMECIEDTEGNEQLTCKKSKGVETPSIVLTQTGPSITAGAANQSR